MELRNVKTANFAEIKKTKPIFKKLTSRNMKNASRSPISTNNISEIDQKEILNIPNFQNSMMTLDISFNDTSRNQEECDNYALYKKYILSKTEYNKLVSEIAYIDNKYNQNNNMIEKLEKILSNLKEEKREKNIILIDLLSNKESLEEIYKIKLSSLMNSTQLFGKKKINGKTQENIDDTNNPFSTIKILEDDNIEIKLDDIKLSDKNKFIEQVINFMEDLIKKKEIETRNRLTQKINIGYQRFFSEIKSSAIIEQSKIISNFFSKISIFISNQNKGKYPEPLINSFLREILKINIINEKISETLKFLNKKYKEKKKEAKEKIANFIFRNENLKTKKLTYENKKNEYKKFIDENRDKIIANEKNKINLENANKQCMSFFLDNHFQEELGFLNDNNKKDELNLIEEKASMKNDTTITNGKDNKENNEIIENSISNNEKVNKIKVLKVKNLQNKWNEKCNGINNINVNNLLINNNINIENNNNIINSTNNSIDNKGENNINNENNAQNSINNDSKIDHEKNVNDSSKKKAIHIKDMKSIPLKQIKLTPKKMNIFHSPIKLNKSNTNKMLFPINPMNKSNFYNKSKSPNRTRTLNFNDINKTFNNNNNITYNPNYKLLTHEIPETFCYFKLSDKSSIKFNPLSSGDINPINFNYFEGSILIDKIFYRLKLIQKSDKKYIGIDLKDIVDINLSEEMEKILKIHKIFLKNGKNQENFDVNKFVSTDNEIIGIRMHQHEKIKAVECKYFIFTIILVKRFVPKAEFIFNNYEHFNLWYNCLRSVVNLNNLAGEKNNK